MKKYAKLFLIFIFAFAVCFLSFAQEKVKTQAEVTSQKEVTPQEEVAPQEAVTPQEKNKIVKGIIEEIAEDGICIVVSGKKINTTKDFIEEAYLEIGDKVKIEAVVEADGTSLRAVDYEYIFGDDLEGEEESAPQSEEIIPQSEEIIPQSEESVPQEESSPSEPEGKIPQQN